MPRRKIELIEQPCKRCGRLVTTTSRALHGLDSLKAQFGVVCKNCATPEEIHALNEAIGKQLANMGGR